MEIKRKIQIGNTNGGILVLPIFLIKKNFYNKKIFSSDKIWYNIYIRNDKIDNKRTIEKL